LNTRSNKSTLTENCMLLLFEHHVWPCKVFLNATSDRDQVGKHLSDTFPIKDGLKQGDPLSPLLFKFELDMPLGGLRQTRRVSNRTVHISSWFSLLMFTYWVEEYVL
jgi:hypothetical protein